MPWVSGGSGSGGLTKLFDSTLSGPAASIDSGAAGFATSFDVLWLWIIARTDEAAQLSTLTVIVNNDSAAHYDTSLIRNRNTTVAGVTPATGSNWPLTVVGGSNTAGYASTIRATIPGYGQTTFNKTGEVTYGAPSSVVSAGEVGVQDLGWLSTAAISRVKIAPVGANLVAGSRLLICAT